VKAELAMALAELEDFRVHPADEGQLWPRPIFEESIHLLAYPALGMDRIIARTAGISQSKPALTQGRRI
jgi:hypothetical protein